MAFCSNCGTALPDNSKFCTECGTPLSEAPAPSFEQTVAEENVSGTAFVPPAYVQPEEFKAPTYEPRFMEQSAEPEFSAKQDITAPSGSYEAPSGSYTPPTAPRAPAANTYIPPVQQNAPTGNTYVPPAQPNRQDTYVPPTAPPPQVSGQQGNQTYSSGGNFNQPPPPSGGKRPARGGGVGKKGRIIGIALTAILLIAAAVFAFFWKGGAKPKPTPTTTPVTAAENLPLEWAGRYNISTIVTGTSTVEGATAQGTGYYVELKQDGTAVVNFGEAVNGTWNTKTIEAAGVSMPFVVSNGVLVINHPSGSVFTYVLPGSIADNAFNSPPVTQAPPPTTAPATPAAPPQTVQSALIGNWYGYIYFYSGTGAYAGSNEYSDAIGEVNTHAETGRPYFEIFSITDVNDAANGSLVFTAYIKNVTDSSFELDFDDGEIYLIDEEKTDAASAGTLTFDLAGEKAQNGTITYYGTYNSADGTFMVEITVRRYGVLWDGAAVLPPKYSVYLNNIGVS